MLEQEREARVQELDGERMSRRFSLWQLFWFEWCILGLVLVILLAVLAIAGCDVAYAEPPEGKGKPERIHVKVKLDKDATAQEAGAGFYTDALPDNLWLGFIAEIANQGRKDFNGGEEILLPLINWTPQEIPERLRKANGKWDKAKLEKHFGVKFAELKKKNPAMSDAE